jgi:hypothetical protein
LEQLPMRSQRICGGAGLRRLRSGKSWSLVTMPAAGAPRRCGSVAGASQLRRSGAAGRRFGTFLRRGVAATFGFSSKATSLFGGNGTDSTSGQRGSNEELCGSSAAMLAASEVNSASRWGQWASNASR